MNSAIAHRWIGSCSHRARAPARSRSKTKRVRKAKEVKRQDHVGEQWQRNQTKRATPSPSPSWPVLIRSTKTKPLGHVLAACRTTSTPQAGPHPALLQRSVHDEMREHQRVLEHELLPAPPPQCFGGRKGDSYTDEDDADAAAAAVCSKDGRRCCFATGRGGPSVCFAAPLRCVAVMSCLPRF